jgi:hypothetical protein
MNLGLRIKSRVSHKSSVTLFYFKQDLINRLDLFKTLFLTNNWNFQNCLRKFRSEIVQAMRGCLKES